MLSNSHAAVSFGSPDLRLCCVAYQELEGCSPLVVTRSLIVKQDYSWLLHVHGRPVESCHDSLTRYNIIIHVNERLCMWYTRNLRAYNPGNNAHSTFRLWEYILSMVISSTHLCPLGQSYIQPRLHCICTSTECDHPT